jgi:hypothetical protein
MPETAVRNEDDLEELPPLDGDSNDPPENEPALEQEDLLDEEGEAATLDDATADEAAPDTTGLDLGGPEGGWLNEGGEAHELDLGDSTIVDFSDEGRTEGSRRGQGGDTGASVAGRSQDLDEDLGVGDEDFGFADAPERGGLDAGDEGPLDADEELREGDLPALDADEEGELEDAALVDPTFASDEPLGLPWAARPWSRVGAPVALAGATAVACIARGALVTAHLDGGEAGLVRLDLEGACDRLSAEGLDPARVRALAVEGNHVAAVSHAGRLFLSSDGGSHFEPMAAAEAIVVSAAVLASGRLWIRTCAGGLLATDPIPAELASSERGLHSSRALIERHPIPGMAAALALDSGLPSGDVVVLVVDDRGQPAAIVRPTGEASTKRQPIEAPDARLPALFAARCGHLAYAARSGGVVRRIAGGGWDSFVWDGRVTAMAFVDDAGTLVASTYSDGDDTSALVRLDSAGNAFVVARLGAVQADARSDGLVAAMAHDEARGVVWVVGGFGVSAFSIN